MERLKTEYQRLKAQLVNEGCEHSSDEVMWNDGILEAIDVLFEEVSDDTRRKVMLNLI